jgi:SAM-dependent methyltransferase
MITTSARRAHACPACLGPLDVPDSGRGLACEGCSRAFPDVAGLIDLRLESDRYLSLEDDRAKAERLHALEPTTDVMGLASAYYGMTGDVVDHRRDRFLRHIAGAEARGEVLAAVLPERGRTLEVGCGTGGLLVAAARSGREIEGVDIAARWLIVARRRLNDRGLDVALTATDAGRLPWPDRTFDAVVADSLLEHLDEPERALREWRRVLKPSGELIVWSPNRFTLATDPHLGLWGVGWLPRRLVPSYLKWRGRSNWPPRTLSAIDASRLARRCGFGWVSVTPPAISERWAQSLPESERRAIRVYEALRRTSAGRAVLKAFGPLWELRALSREGA